MAATSLGPPVAGAYFCPVLSISNVLTNSTVIGRLKLPAGMTATLFAVSIQGDGLGSDPAITIGTNASNAGILAVELAADSVLRVAVVNDTGDSIKCANIGFWMWVRGHATNIPADGGV
jgi:hypothetical protein